MLPRLDPVVHGDWTPGAPLSRDQTERFERDGFVVLHDLFTAQEIAALQASATRLIADPGALDARTVISEPGVDEVRSIFMIHRQNALMERLARDERLAGIARFILDDEVYLHQSRLNYKPGFVGREFYWHSDFETWHVEDGMPRMRSLSMSVLLAPNTATNGPLMLIPGSHRSYCACAGETPEEHYLASLRKQEYGVPDTVTLAGLAAEGGIAAPTGEAGTVVVFDCNVMHGSNGNITPFPRANAFFVYNAVSNRLTAPFGVPQPRPEFVAARQGTHALPRPGSTLLETARSSQVA
ncbi:ectoine hydroxylase [Novosphingobium album (ex Liu et al. 2023)]|uniref:Ectoine hydroxylase n=1 Tax=Novosphingobium album (ex Liu et al. 2023) TaxID=3031130 RepID=A0ABT5WXQ4_9SPHN|nr:ectoine hydroxylase [Novosphingobium album (ex Liu et al. 2023)]MDE8654688.1 ectoine hydroxylase [Novosphingobium album (ex Liu et al. 2023)]